MPFASGRSTNKPTKQRTKVDHGRRGHRRKRWCGPHQRNRRRRPSRSAPPPKCQLQYSTARADILPTFPAMVDARGIWPRQPRRARATPGHCRRPRAGRRRSIIFPGRKTENRKACRNGIEESNRQPPRARSRLSLAAWYASESAPCDRRDIGAVPARSDRLAPLVRCRRRLLRLERSGFAAYARPVSKFRVASAAWAPRTVAPAAGNPPVMHG